MAEADARAARVSQFLAKLSLEAELSSLALGPYTRVVDSYVKCCFVSLRMQEDDISAGERAVWNALVEANATFVALEDEERLDPFRVALKAWYLGKRRTASAARAGGGVL